MGYCCRIASSLPPVSQSLRPFGCGWRVLMFRSEYNVVLCDVVCNRLNRPTHSLHFNALHGSQNNFYGKCLGAACKYAQQQIKLQQSGEPARLICHRSKNRLSTLNLNWRGRQLSYVRAEDSRQQCTQLTRNSSLSSSPCSYSSSFSSPSSHRPTFFPFLNGLWNIHGHGHGMKGSGWTTEEKDDGKK